MLLWGGLTTNFIWCMILNARNKTFGDYTNKKTPLKANYIFAALAGTTWFLQVFLLWNGRKQIGQWRQFMDIAHGIYYSGSQYVGDLY